MKQTIQKEERGLLKLLRRVMPKAADWAHLVLFFLTLVALDYGFQYFFLHLRVIDKGDYLLLCSDGLSNMMDDQEILFEVVHGVNKQHCCQRLLDIAKNRGAPDNVTSVLIQV